MGKRILCIGDSNTWGYIPGSGERYEKNVRWTGKLAQTLGENYEVIEEGMNGRTTAFTDKIEPGTAALDYLYPCLISQFPLDYIIVMLGTNDTKTRYGVNTVEIGYGLDEVLLKIEETCRRKKIVSYGPKLAVASRGADGCILYDGQEYYVQKAVPIKEVVDTMGAGDSLITSFMVAYTDHLKKGITGETAIRESLAAAAEFASKVCGMNGAFGYGKKYE